MMEEDWPSRSHYGSVPGEILRPLIPHENGQCSQAEESETANSCLQRVPGRGPPSPSPNRWHGGPINTRALEIFCRDSDSIASLELSF